VQITVDQTILAAAIARAASISEKKSTIPVLTCALIRADQSVTIQATDMNSDTTETIRAVVVDPGAVAVSAAMLSDIVRRMPKGSEVTISAPTPDKVTIKCGRSQFSLAGMSPEDFPSIREMRGTAVKVEIASAELLGIFDRTEFAVSSEETKYYLNGVFFHIVDGTIRAAATDGHRLATVNTGIAGDIPPVIIPRLAIPQLRRIIGDYDGPVQVSFDETRVGFTLPSIEMVSKVVEGTFPDYQRIIPQGGGSAFQFNTADLKNAVDHVLVVLSEKSKRVHLDVSDGKMLITCASHTQNAGAHEIECSLTGDPAKISFSGVYLSDALSVMGEVTVIHMGDNAREPCRIVSPDDPSIVVAVAPMGDASGA
jgi:DNA polymerase III subunit beta